MWFLLIFILFGNGYCSAPERTASICDKESTEGSEKDPASASTNNFSLPEQFHISSHLVTGDGHERYKSASVINPAETISPALGQSHSFIFDTAEKLVTGVYRMEGTSHFFCQNIGKVASPVTRHALPVIAEATPSARLGIVHAYIPLLITECFQDLLLYLPTAVEPSSIFLCTHAVLKAIDNLQHKTLRRASHGAASSSRTKRGYAAKVSFASQCIINNACERYKQGAIIVNNTIPQATQDLILTIATQEVESVNRTSRLSIVSHGNIGSNNYAKSVTISYPFSIENSSFMLHAYAPVIMTICYEEYLRRLPGHETGAIMVLCAHTVLKAIENVSTKPPEGSIDDKKDDAVCVV
ncbi:hypothetical protein FJ365_00080 [Candidatus Dependentiae bacterium]|nr:hypothetical protein [Candidatus Dependentiae bacterium]